MWVVAKYLGADHLGVNPRKFMYRLVEDGTLKPTKIGRFSGANKIPLFPRDYE